MKGWKSRTLLVLSSGAAAYGVFLPLATVPVYGEVTYRDAYPVAWYFVVAFALAAPALLLAKKRRLTVLASIGLWCTLLWQKIEERLFAEEPGVFESMVDAAASPVEETAADFVLDISTFEWGGLLFLGACVVHALSSIVVTVGKR